MKADDVCQLKYVEGSQVLTPDEMKVGAPRPCLILPVSKLNFEERAWSSQLLLEHNSALRPLYNNEAWWSRWKEQDFLHLLPFYSRSNAKNHTNMKANDVCQLKYVEDSQALTNDEMGTGAQIFHPILPVSEQNFEEQAWSNQLLLERKSTLKPLYNNEVWWSKWKEQDFLHLPPFIQDQMQKTTQT